MTSAQLEEAVGLTVGGMGAMTDFGAILAKPKTLLLGVAAQAGCCSPS